MADTFYTELKEMARGLIRETECRSVILDNVPASRRAWAHMLTNCNFDIPRGGSCAPAPGAGCSPCGGVSPDLAVALAASGYAFPDVAEFFLDPRVGQALHMNKLTRAVQGLAGLAYGNGAACPPFPCGPAACPPFPCGPAACPPAGWYPPAACQPHCGPAACCPTPACDPCPSGLIGVTKAISYQAPVVAITTPNQPVVSGPFTKQLDNSKLLIQVSGSVTGVAVGLAGVAISLDNPVPALTNVVRGISTAASRETLVPQGIILSNISKGAHTVYLRSLPNTSIAVDDFFDVIVSEFC